MNRRSFIACIVPVLAAAPIAAKSAIAPLTPVTKVPHGWTLIVDHASGLLKDAVVYDDGREIKQIYKVIRKGNAILMYFKNPEHIKMAKVSTNWEIHSENSILMSAPKDFISADQLKSLTNKFIGRKPISKIDHSLTTEIMKL